MYISSHLLHSSLRSLWEEGAKLQASLWVLLLAGAGRSDIDALDQRCLQRDVELLQCLQHADQGIDKCVVFDQCHILIHVQNEIAPEDVKYRLETLPKAPLQLQHLSYFSEPKPPWIPLSTTYGESHKPWTYHGEEPSHSGET